ncbi:MAG TPA: hypothetical protein VNP37_18390 [Actinomycetospora sp.]|nr:hypothetical protein [Actinomycetospora sp.]
MAATSHDAHAPGEQVTDSARTQARTQVRLEHTRDDAELTVFQTAQWVPPAYRQAYLEGAARVLGHAPPSDS